MAFRHLLVFLAVGLLLTGTGSCSKQEDGEGPSPPPRLVVLLVVDQMKADYMDRFRPFFRDGIARLLDTGAVFTDARHRHAITSTGPGHATISTGNDPARHGIVSNTIPGAETGTFKRVGKDPENQNLDGSGMGYSPRDLLRPALGDWMKEADPRSKTAALAYKPRAAVMLGGWNPDACIYANPETGEYTTSDYYENRLPEWVEQFNRENPASGCIGKSWDSLLTEEEFVAAGCGADRETYEGRLGFGNTEDQVFPHLVNVATDLPFTPFADQRTLELAATAVEALNLGQDGVTDVLAISMSAADYIGHAYGSQSREMADYYRHLDIFLADLFTLLDQKVGKNNYLVGFTSDHGVAPIVESRLERGLSAGRIPAKRLPEAVDQELDEKYGTADWALESTPDIFLNHKAIEERGLDPETVRQEAMLAVIGIEGVAKAFSFQQLQDRDPGIPSTFQWSFHPARSGDIMICLEPYFHLDYLHLKGYIKANHASHFDYDQQVPVILMGPRIASGKRSETINTIDIAPSIASLIGVSPPEGIDGRILRIGKTLR